MYVCLYIMVHPHNIRTHVCGLETICMSLLYDISTQHTYACVWSGNHMYVCLYIMVHPHNIRTYVHTCVNVCLLTLSLTHVCTCTVAYICILSLTHSDTYVHTVCVQNLYGKKVTNGCVRKISHFLHFCVFPLHVYKYYLY